MGRTRRDLRLRLKWQRPALQGRTRPQGWEQDLLPWHAHVHPKIVDPQRKVCQFKSGQVRSAVCSGIVEMVFVSLRHKAQNWFVTLQCKNSYQLVSSVSLQRKYVDTDCSPVFFSASCVKHALLATSHVSSPLISSNLLVTIWSQLSTISPSRLEENKPQSLHSFQKQTYEFLLK
ncbi:hypothetical protein H5410_022574 [Solanum commersonii]|uniref:Uncharacterized protein n=1 Tax=Solanum commersonii TaxID=4109 RepID=A0A9J5ZFU5_SOLCO|nr:hypothetical protein H5410_022574 [Solanum commersonii]